jgi:hypothetical protein
MLADRHVLKARKRSNLCPTVKFYDIKQTIFPNSDANKPLVAENDEIDDSWLDDPSEAVHKRGRVGQRQLARQLPIMQNYRTLG